MNRPPAASLKRLSVWVTVIAVGLICSYLGLISLVSVFIGLSHLQQDGFWVPLLAGVLLLLALLWIFFRIPGRLLAHMKEKDVVHI